MEDHYLLILPAACAGLVADLLIRWLKPSVERSGSLRWFALTVPLAYYALYYVVLIMTRGLEWSVHVWTGTIVLSGCVGLLLSYILLPPSIPPIQADSWRSSSSRESLSHAKEREGD
jgi:hypothetical protein